MIICENIFTQDEAVTNVVDFMNSYSISQEDYDTIMELAKFKVYTRVFFSLDITATVATMNLANFTNQGRANPLEGVPPAVKAALTKKYNETSKTRMVRAADMVQLPGMKKAPKKRIAAMLEPTVDSLRDEDGEPLAEDDGEENASDAEEDSGTVHRCELLLFLVNSGDWTCIASERHCKVTCGILCGTWMKS